MDHRHFRGACRGNPYRLVGRDTRGHACFPDYVAAYRQNIRVFSMADVEAIYYYSFSPESTRTTLPLRVQAAPAFAGVFFCP